MVNAQANKVIDDLKKVRKEKNISFEEIVRRTEANGERVSLSSVKNVFKEETKHNHNYEHTIKPIARALEAEDKKVDDSDYQLVVARLDLKDTMLKQQEELIKELKARLERKEERYHELLSLYKEQMSFYKDQIAVKDSQIKRYEQNIDRKDAMLRKHFLTAEE